MLIAVSTERKCRPGHNDSHQQSFVWLTLKNTAIHSDESISREKRFSTVHIPVQLTSPIFYLNIMEN